MEAGVVETCPRFPEGMSGFEFSERPRRQAERFDLLMDNGRVSELIPGQPLYPTVKEGRRSRPLYRLGCRHRGGKIS